MLFPPGSPKGPGWNFGLLGFRSLPFAYPQPIRRNRFQKHIFGPVLFRNECRNTRNNNLYFTDISVCTCVLHVRWYCYLFSLCRALVRFTDRSFDYASNLNADYPSLLTIRHSKLSFPSEGRTALSIFNQSGSEQEEDTLFVVVVESIVLFMTFYL